jgi:hypothetical protein
MVPGNRRGILRRFFLDKLLLCFFSESLFSAGSTPLPISRAHRLDRQGSDSFENWRGLASDIRRLRPVLCFSDNSYILRHQS